MVLSQKSYHFLLQERKGDYFPLFPSIILQKITATIVLTAVAAIPAPTIPAGFTLPYWLLYGCVKLRLKNCSPICLISFHYHNSIPDLHVKALHLL